MSKSQQEIAAPFDRNSKKNNLVLFFTAAAFIATAAFTVYAKKADLYYQSPVLGGLLLVLLLWLSIAALTTALVFNVGRPLYVLLAFAALSAGVIVYLINTKATVLAGNFTDNMLVLLIVAVFLLALAVFFAIKFRREKGSIFAVICGLFVSLPQLFATLFPLGVNFAANVWGVAGGSVLAALCAFFIMTYFVGRVHGGRIKTKWITYCATFAALSVVFKIMGNAVSFIPTLRFTLTYIPWVVAGIVLGPVGGIVTACVGDVLGQTILPSGIGSLNPFITLSNTLFALFPALMYQYSPLRKIGGLDWLNILIGMIISTLVCTLGISSWAIWAQNFSSMGYWEYFVFNRLPQPIMVAVNYVSIIALLPALKRAKITNLKFLERVQAADKYTKDKDGK